MHHRVLRVDPVREREGGMALIVAILFTIIVVGITVTGALVLRSHQTKTKTNFVTHGQAVRFARSGLIESLGWLRKQSAQPVTAFEPVLDAGAPTPVLDTIDPEIGIVREFKITGAIWGRYEVWKDWPADPDAARLQWRNQMRCLDVAESRGGLAAGTVWRMRSIGYVFRRIDATKAFNELPNQVIGREILDFEARRLSLEPPGQAALCSRRGNAVSIQTKGRVVGGAAACGIYYPTSTGSPSVSGTGASVTGAPATSSVATYADGYRDVFGVSLVELEAMANYVVTDASSFPVPVPLNSLVVCKVPISFTALRPLRGTGVVVFTAPVDINAGSYSSFSGLMYVDSTLAVHAPAEVQGALVVTGATTVVGASDFATLSYDDGILNSLRQDLGSYRASSAFIRPRQLER